MPDTDIKINYYLRQQKSIERKMLCHLLRELNASFRLKDYRYIGMGAKYFVDFLLFHNEFGFQNMISIESDIDNCAKYDFNNPLKCIKMEYNFSSEALRNIDWNGCINNIIWLDYDSQLKAFMMEDIETMISKLKSGSMFFISFNSQQPHFSERVERFRQNMGIYCPASTSLADLAELRKHGFFKRIINNVIETAIRKRNLSLPPEEQISFQQLAYFLYKDGAEMITIGGILLNQEDQNKYRTLYLDQVLDFLVESRDEPPYSLIIPPLTYKELNYLFKQLPTENIADVNIPGISQAQIEAIIRVYRYYPVFLEAATFN